jgi:hypothetical protein
MEKKEEILLKTNGGEITHMFEVPVRFYKTTTGEHTDAFRVKREKFVISYILQDTPTNLCAVSLNILPFVEYYIYYNITNNISDTLVSSSVDKIHSFKKHDNFVQEETGYPSFYFVWCDMPFTLNIKKGSTDFMNSSITSSSNRDGKDDYIIYFNII